MTDQLALALDTPRVAVHRRRRTDPDTSVHRKGENSALMLAIEADLRANGPGTDWEILRRLGEPERRIGSVSKRRFDLGCVDTGDRRYSPDARPCIVWRLP